MPNLFDNTTGSQIFKDKKPLDPEVTPEIDELVCRDDEIDKLVDHFEDLINYSTAENLLITGDTGVGKTATTKTVLADLRDTMQDRTGEFRDIYMTDMQNERNVLRKLSKKLDLEFYGSSDLEEYYERLGTKLIEEDLNVVIVMDEVDKLFEKGYGNSLFKRLLEVRNRANSADTGYLLLISITNNVKTPDFFDPRVESRHGTNSIHFSSYNAMELKEILVKRAEKAYREDTLDDGVMSKCAAMVASKDGDARKAIKLLRKSGVIAENQGDEYVGKEHLELADKALETKRIMDAVRSCSTHSKLVLYAAIDLNGKPEISTGDVYTRYEKWCQKFEDSSLTQRRISSLIEKLDMRGLLTAEIVNEGRRSGRTRKISMTLEGDTVEEVKNSIEESFGYSPDENPSL